MKSIQVIDPLAVFGYRELHKLGYGSRATIWRKSRAGEFPEPAFYLGESPKWTAQQLLDLPNWYARRKGAA